MIWWRPFARRQRERELDAELHDHLERMIAASGRWRGRTGGAKASAGGFGGVEPIKEKCGICDARAWIDETLQDVRHALRRCRNSAGFSAVAVLTSPSGLAPTPPCCSLVDAILLRPCRSKIHGSSCRSIVAGPAGGAGHLACLPVPARQPIVVLRSGRNRPRVALECDLRRRSRTGTRRGELVTGNFTSLCSACGLRSGGC